MAPAPHATEAQAFATRLRRALSAAGVKPSPTLIANEFNLRYWGRSVTPHTARNWLLGISIPTQDKLRALADWLQVSPDELRFGENVGSNVHVVREPATSWSDLSMQDREMLKRYHALSSEARKTVREVIAALHAKEQAPTPPP
jgi:transcriptional regulator with XRE-family HTH domain